jgi:glyoxylate/hydroxypyruvate reductase
MSIKIFRLFSKDHFNLSKLIQKSHCASMSTSIALKTSNRLKVFVTQPIPVEAIELLNSNKSIDLFINDQLPLSREKLLNSVVDCDALFCTLNEKIDNELLDKAGSKLKVIATCSVGYDHIDLKECKSRNIPVGYTPGVLTGILNHF